MGQPLMDSTGHSPIELYINDGSLVLNRLLNRASFIPRFEARRVYLVTPGFNGRQFHANLTYLQIIQIPIPRANYRVLFRGNHQELGRILLLQQILLEPEVNAELRRGYASQEDVLGSDLPTLLAQ